MHLSIRTAANPGARCSETEIEGDLLTPELAAFSSGPQAACPEPVEGSRSPRAGSFGFAQDRRSRSARCRLQDGNPGGAAIFPRVVSRRSFLLWPCWSGISSSGGSQPLTPGSGAWLFPDRHFGSTGMSQRGHSTLYGPEYPDLARASPAATRRTAASFSSARYRRFISSSPCEKLSAFSLSHFWGPLHSKTASGNCGKCGNSPAAPAKRG